MYKRFILNITYQSYVCFRNDGQEFAGSVYQKVNPELETAVTLSWTSGTNATRFALGAKYTLDKNASINVSNISIDKVPLLSQSLL